MLISAIGNRRARGDAGYTLVEALTALAVVAFAAGAVLLMAPGGDRQTRSFAERFAAQAALAGQESIIRNRPVGLMITAEGFGYARLEAAGWQRIEGASALAFSPWPDHIAHRVEDGAYVDDPREDGLAVRFDATGGATPARIAFSGDGARWVVEIDGQGRAHVSRPD